MNITEIINPQNRNVIAWYPSSGLDFRDLLVLGQKKFIYDNNAFANELLEFETIPDLFIHNDSAYNVDNWPLLNSGIVFSDDDSEYAILSTNNVFDDDRVVAKYLSIRIDHKLLNKSTNQKLLFVFSDNLLFFTDYVLKLNLTIDFLINIRDGFSENGGADYSMKFLEFFLGKMNTKFIISDNFGREYIENEDLLSNKVIREAFHSTSNHHVVLQGVKEINWSEFGVFQGDAFLIKIHRFGS